MATKRFFTPDVVFMMYDMYANGDSDVKVAAALQMPTTTFQRRRDQHPGAKAACKYGKRKWKATRENRDEFDSIVFGRLPDELKEIWEVMKEESKNPTGYQPVQHMEMRQKQILWVHAWVKHNFSVRKACIFLQIPQRTVQLWKEQAAFKKLMDGMMEVKKDFVEDNLLGLIKRQNPMATVFAAKTLLRDRGYGERTEIVGKVEHEHTMHHQIDLTKLDLPFDVQMIVMDAIEKAKKLEENIQPLVLEHKG